jgi:hypothetical protein
MIESWETRYGSGRGSGYGIRRRGPEMPREGEGQMGCHERLRDAAGRGMERRETRVMMGGESVVNMASPAD